MNKEYHRVWRANNRDKCSGYGKKHYNKRSASTIEKVKVRSRKHHLRRKYGITPDQYDAILAAQGGVCNICQKPGRTGRWNKLVVDHCHETGKVRGLLCSGCNVAVASLGDGIIGVWRALAHVQGRLIHDHTIDRRHTSGGLRLFA